jgi:hypothetical protein
MDTRFVRNATDGPLAEVPQQYSEIGFLGTFVAGSGRVFGDFSRSWRAWRRVVRVWSRFSIGESLKGVVVKTFGIE